MELDRIPLWRGDHVPIRQLAEDFFRYVYLPRLREPEVLTAAVQDGLGLLLWRQETFAYADDYDAATGRYVGLRCGQRIDVFHDTGSGLVVKPDIAAKQDEADRATVSGRPAGGPMPGDGKAETGISDAGDDLEPAPDATRSCVDTTGRSNWTRRALDRRRAIADEVVAHLAGLIGAEITVTLEIDATVPDGVPDQVVRTVTENGRTLKFTSQGFETNSPTAERSANWFRA